MRSNASFFILSLISLWTTLNQRLGSKLAYWGTQRKLAYWGTQRKLAYWGTQRKLAYWGTQRKEDIWVLLSLQRLGAQKFLISFL